MMAITELIGRSLFVAGGVAPERVDALRAALAKMAEDPAFREECEKAKLDLDFVPGAKLQALVAELMASPPSVVERFREAVRSRK